MAMRKSYSASLAIPLLTLSMISSGVFVIMSGPFANPCNQAMLCRHERSAMHM